MPELSLNNIKQISKDVSNQEITFSHLLEDLIDHICCDVENEMQCGLPFAEAYRVVKNKMGPSIKYWFLSRPFQANPVKNYLLTGCSAREELDAALAEYFAFFNLRCLTLNVSGFFYWNNIVND